MADSLLASATTAELREAAKRIAVDADDFEARSCSVAAYHSRLAAAALSLIAEGRERKLFSANTVIVVDEDSVALLRALAGGSP